MLNEPFLGAEPETVLNLFCQCHFSCIFWKDREKLMFNKTKLSLTITFKDISKTF